MKTPKSKAKVLDAIMNVLKSDTIILEKIEVDEENTLLLSRLSYSDEWRLTRFHN